MVKSGLAVHWAIVISLLVYAGSAQLATLPLIVAGQPFWLIALAGFVTNLRFVIYSASTGSSGCDGNYSLEAQHGRLHFRGNARRHCIPLHLKLHALPDLPHHARRWGPVQE